MNLHPFYEVAANAEAQMQKGATIHQQFLCQHCGAKQTMETANKFFRELYQASDSAEKEAHDSGEETTNRKGEVTCRRLLRTR